jgi:hypothetical protein
MVPAGPVVAAGGQLALARSTVRGQPTTWSIVPSPSRGNDYLWSVSCASVTYCVTVGQSLGPADKTLIEVWDGTSWSIVPSPGKYRDSILYGVSCTSSSACAAVGDSYSRQRTAKSLIESWNGTAWSVVPSPNPATGPGTDDLRGVSCTSATACTAVGWYTKAGSSARTLIETWNGTTWSVAHSKNAGRDSTLSGVSCLSASSCTAVGSWVSKHALARPLIESWDGTAWSIVPNPGPVNAHTNLAGISCTAGDACMAVGYAGSNPSTTLAESWNGTAWSVVPTPSPARALNDLSGVSCTTADSCTAAGSSWAGSGSTKTLIESWDGPAWTIVPSPSPGGQGTAHYLNSVSCATATTCMATGFLDHGGLRTFTELGS